MESSFPKSLMPGESVFATGKLKCGFSYEVVGLPMHQYALLIEGIRVWEEVGFVSDKDAEAQAKGWDDHTHGTVRRLEGVLALQVGRTYVLVWEGQSRLDYVLGLQDRLSTLYKKGSEA